MTNIIVTTPKSQMANAAQEAADCIANGGGYYFRRLPYLPWRLGIGEKVFYVEDGHIRGFAVVDQIIENIGAEAKPWRCETTGIEYPPGIFVVMRADSWKWIKPIPHRGFQHFRYIEGMHNIEIIGDWLAPRPEVIAA